MDEKVYQLKMKKEENLNVHVRRIQFATLNTRKNKRFSK